MRYDPYKGVRLQRVNNGYTTSHEILFARSDARDNLGDLVIDGLIILEIILQK